MLELQVTGDTHPKTFTLKTDDSEGELDRLREILEDEMEVGAGDPLHDWFMGHSSDEFAEGVPVPTDQVGEFEDVLEGDWYEEAAKIGKEREAAMAAAEAALGNDGD